jgi:GDP-D-mannose dehydratase
VYNLGAQSHVKVSFEMAEYTVSNIPISDVSTGLRDRAM